MRRLSLWSNLLSSLMVVSATHAAQIDVDGHVHNQAGQQISIRGVNWHGLETPSHRLDGLDEHASAMILDHIHDLGINTIQFPLCPNVLDDNTVSPSNSSQNPQLVGKKPLQILDALVDEAGQNQMMVMFSFAVGGCDHATLASITDASLRLAQHYHSSPAVMGLAISQHDPLSRPHEWTGRRAGRGWRQLIRLDEQIHSLAPDWLMGIDPSLGPASCNQGRGAGHPHHTQACFPLPMAPQRMMMMPRWDQANAAQPCWSAQRCWRTTQPIAVVLRSTDFDPQHDGSARVDALRSHQRVDGFYSSWLATPAWPHGLVQNDHDLSTQQGVVDLIQRWWDGEGEADEQRRHARRNAPQQPSPNQPVSPVVNAPPAAPPAPLPTPPAAPPSSEPSTSQDALPGWDATYTGTATYTGSGYSGGAVLLDPIPSDAEITALNPTQMRLGGIPAALAGAYLAVTGPHGTTTVYVTDLYPEGASGGLDLSPNAFAKIGDMAAGRIPIQWHVVPAPISGPVVYRIKEGISKYWAAIQVRHSVYPVIKLEVKQGDDWISLPKRDYNHFEGRDLGDQPLTLRLTDIRGEQRVDTLSLSSGQAIGQAVLVTGQVQFTP